MDLKACAQCGVDIEGEGLVFRGRTFCGDECCEEFQEGAVDEAEPDLAALEDDDFEDDLGYRSDADDFDEDDDDYAIDPDDF